MDQPERKDFFISYNKADRAWAEWIAWELEAAGYSVIIQAWDFRPGRNFVLEMQKAAKEARRTIAVLSPDYFTAQFTQPEWAAAFAQDPTGEKGLLVPVRVRKVDLEGLLGPIIHIDLVNLDEESTREALIVGVEQRRAKPSTAPEFPGAKPKSEKPGFPGALPSIWNVPHQRNPNFTGREELLERLRRAVTGGQGAALTQTFAGLGGVGKTQMAAEYAYRYASDYDLVWWLRSEDATTLAADYAKLAIDLDLPEKDAPQQEAAVAAVRQKLRQLGKWLLIFDNANDPKDIRAYLPQGGGGQVIITSRNRAWGGLGKVVKVTVWERGESVAFLLKRSYPEKEPSEEEKAAAAELAKELGDLPLALEQAGAYIEECGCTIAHYLEIFRERRRELLRLGKLSQDYPDTVATTWHLSFQKVQEECPAAADLLNLCAFLAPDDIPKELLEKGAKHLPEQLAQAVQNPLALNQALAALRRYSLMEVGADGLSMHRLVQAVVRDRLDDAGKKQWAGATVEVVNEAFPGAIQANPEVWPWCARLLPHSLTAAGYAQDLMGAPEAAGYLFNQAGQYLRTRAESAEARKAYERALTIAEAAYGPDHIEVAPYLNNLGSVLQELGDLEGAKAHLERSLDISEKLLGPTHPNVAIVVNNLGTLLRALGDLAAARSHLERALAIWEKALGPDHPNVASAINNLGRVLRELGDLSGAKSQYEQALAIHEAAYGPNHPEVAVNVSNLGLLLMDLGNLEDAKVNLERALSIMEKVHGPDHPDVAMAMNNLGGVLLYQGDLAGARAHFERALAILRQFLGENHPKTKIGQENLASLG